MARIYNYEEIQQFPPPTAETFAAELTHLRIDLTDMYEQVQFSGAFIFGSATYGASTERSDIDVIVATPELTFDLMDGVRALRSTVYNRSGIPVDLLCRTEHELSSGEHGQYREPFIGWAQQQAEKYPNNVIGVNPVSLMRPPQTDIIHDIGTYLSLRIQELGKAYTNGADSQDILRDVLNTPLRLGRQSVAALQHRGYIAAGTLTSADRGSVIRAVEESLGAHEPEIPLLCQKLQEVAETYAQLVEGVRSDGVTEEEYEQRIHDAAVAGLPKALALAIKMRDAYHVIASNA